MNSFRILSTYTFSLAAIVLVACGGQASGAVFPADLQHRAAM